MSGVGSTVPSLDRGEWSRREADLAIRVLATHPDRSIAPIEEVRAETIVLALRDHALGDAYLRSGPVETLRHHDEQKGTSYVETLEAYFERLRLRSGGGQSGSSCIRTRFAIGCAG